jgi:hypothetical protein
MLRVLLWQIVIYTLAMSEALICAGFIPTKKYMHDFHAEPAGLYILTVPCLCSMELPAYIV